MLKVVGCIGLLVLGLSGLDCGSAATSQSSPPANRITGASSCAGPERLNLVFSGQLSGHITCSAAPLTCTHAWTTPVPPGGLVAPVKATAGSIPVQLTVSLGGDYQPGTYVAGNPGEGASRTSDYGVTLDGLGSWVSELGGSIVVSGVDSRAAEGTLNVRLQSRSGGPGTIRVSGSWRCLKPAGF